MKYLFSLAFLTVSLSNIYAQGFSAPWDVSQTASALAAHAAKLAPVLDQLRLAEWQAKGAPEAYVAQARSIQTEAGYLIDSARAFEKQPDKLSLAIATYFRMQSVEKMMDSLADGVRRYQDPQLGDELISTVAANFTNRDQLRQYISDLAEAREQEFRVIDSEAQRCRNDLMRLPPPSQNSTPRRTPQK